MTCRYCSKYKAIYPPKGNCTACWDKFFTKQVGRYSAAKLALEKLGASVVEQVQGTKYLKQLKRFIKENDVTVRV